MTRLVERVPEALAGMRVDQILAELFADYSRSKLQTWMKAGRVLVNGHPLKPKDRLEGGENIEVDAEPEVVIRCDAEDIPLDIVFEDKALLIVNKPAGLVVHPAVGNWNGTLQNALLNHLPKLATLPRAGIVHRIDKDTSGLLIRQNPASASCLDRSIAGTQYPSGIYCHLERSDDLWRHG